METTPKFRASYSVLSQWKSGRWEDAIALYFKLAQWENPAMEAGKEWHAKWEEEGIKTGCLPEIFGGKKLQDPQFEVKFVHEIEPWLDLVGVLDVLDSPDIYDYKTGVTSAANYANTPQGGIYALLATLEGHYVEKMHYLAYNQHTKKKTVAMVWVTDKVLEDAMDFVKTYAAEMHQYLIDNDLYAQLGEKKGGVEA